MFKPVPIPFTGGECAASETSWPNGRKMLIYQPDYTELVPPSNETVGNIESGLVYQEYLDNGDTVSWEIQWFSDTGINECEEAGIWNSGFGGYYRASLIIYTPDISDSHWGSEYETNVVAEVFAHERYGAEEAYPTLKALEDDKADELIKRSIYEELCDLVA